MKNCFIFKLWMLFLLCKNSAYADEPSEDGVNTEGPVKATEDAIESPVNVTAADTEGPSKESLRLDLENILKDQSVDQEMLQKLIVEQMNRMNLKNVVTMTPEDSTCDQKETEHNEEQEVSDDKLYHIRSTLLESLDCGDTNCTRIIIESTGAPVDKHPTRFGIYTLSSLYEGYPVYSHTVSGDHLFYQHEFIGWEYAHRIERWIIGQEVGVCEGSVMFLSEEKCPWEMKAKSTEVYYYDEQKTENVWNPEGNGWKLDDSVSIRCYDESTFPAFDCGCPSLVVSLVEDVGVAEVRGSVKSALGRYEVESHSWKEGLLAPVFVQKTLYDGLSKPAKPVYLYSHHTRGRYWLMGSSLQKWFARLNLLSSIPSKDDGQYCPNNYPKDPKKQNVGWEFLTKDSEGKDSWKAETVLRVTCDLT